MAETVSGILLAAAIVGALVVLGRVVVWLFAFLRKAARIIDALTGEPPGPGFPDGRPGLIERLDSLEVLRNELAEVKVRIAAVEAQLIPNGGGTLRDAVDRISPHPDGTAPLAAESTPASP